MFQAQDLIHILPLLILIGWACVLLLVDLFIREKAVTAILAMIGLATSLAATIIDAGGGKAVELFNAMIVVDSYAFFLNLLFLISGLIAIALAFRYLRQHAIERGEFYALMLLSISGMMLMTVAGDLMVVFLALELLSLPLYVMAGFARPKVESEEAALKYFLLGAFASSFVVYGIAMTFGATGTTSISGIMAVAEGLTGLNKVLLGLGSALIMVGLGFKVAVVPFHMWTPDVYQGAPTPVTAFMAIGAKAAGFAGLLRVFVAAFPGIADGWVLLVMWIAALTMAWGNVAAIAQTNIKRMLAYSSIAHAGYILMSLPAAGTAFTGDLADSAILADEAVRSALFYLVAYAVTNLGAWGVVLLMEKVEGKGLEIQDYAGLGSRRPWLAIVMTLFMLSLTGVPPTIGFMGKFYLFRAVLRADLVWLALVGVVTSLISAYYYLRVVVVMYMQDGEPEPSSEPLTTAVVGIMGLATFVFGLWPTWIVDLVEKAKLYLGH
jgi:NADH-quinone oxidoreductase subunit N